MAVLILYSKATFWKISEAIYAFERIRPGDTATPTLALALRLNAIAHVLLLPWSPKPRPLRHHYVIKYTRPSPIFQRVILRPILQYCGEDQIRYAQCCGEDLIRFRALRA